MLKKLFAVVLAAGGLVFAVNAGAQDVWRAKGQVDSAFAYSPSGDAYVAVSVQVSTTGGGGKPAKAESVFLMYQVLDPLRGWRFWFGEISANDLSGGGGSSLNVSTNTCNYNSMDGCGQVSVQFQKSDAWSRSFNGRTTTTNGNMRTMQIGQTETSSAAVNGTVTGVSFGGGVGEISTGRMNDMTIQRGR
jgi:hypothetical protein